jgi:hypothetical protein
VAALIVAGVALGAALWSLAIATRARDFVGLLLMRGRVTPPSHDNDEGHA